MNALYALLAAIFFSLTFCIDTVYGHTILGKVACVFSLLNTIGFALLALPSDHHPKE